MSPPLSPINLIVQAAEHLGDLRDQATFIGGAVVPLLVTDSGARSPRPTNDVDITIELASRMAFYDFEKMLKARGFRNVIEGPICRFQHGITILDVMPTDSDVLGFSNRWYPAAIRSAQRYMLNNQIEINLITSPCFLATKLEAFDSPTREYQGDMYGSRDFEDVVTLLDGRKSVVQEILDAPTDVKSYLQERFTLLMKERYWEDGVEAHLEKGRLDIVAGRIKSFLNP